MRLLWLFLSALPQARSDDDLTNPAWCAAATTLMVNDLVLCAQNVVAMTGDCMGELVSPPDCAADIASFMANILDAAQAAAAIAVSCKGDTDTTCEQLAIDAPESLMNAMADLVGASTNCDIDAFLCTINLADAVKQMLGFAVDVDDAVDTCPTESLLEQYLKQVYPDWPGWNWVSPRILESAAKALKNSTGAGTQSRKIGVLDLNDGGPILAADHVGYSKVGSAIAVRMGGESRRLAAQEAVLLPSLHDLDCDVWPILSYPQELSSADLQRAYE